VLTKTDKPADNLLSGMDPLTFEVMRNAFLNLTEEMALTVRRAAYSTNIKTRADFSCAFFDSDLRVIAQSFAQPAHLVSMANVLPGAVREFGIDRLGPGDAILVNDPHRGSSHLNDIACISPVFVGDERIGYLANMAHHVDVGGASPASLGLNREIFQEGVTIPPTRIMRAGEIDGDVLRLLLANVRAPRETNGDLRAQISANRTGQARVARLVDRYPVETLRAFFDVLIRYTERWTEREIDALPQGTWSAEGFRDDDGFTDQPIRLKATVTIGGGHVTLDVTGSDAQRPSSINATRAMSKCCLAFVVRCLMSERLPVNSGFLNRIRITGPDGTVCTAVHPAAVVGGWEVGQRLAELIWLALYQTMPGRVPAASKGIIVNLGFGGYDPRRGEYFCYMETMAGGGGARATMDGADAVQTTLHNTENAPIEEVEINYPFRIKRYELIEDSAGPGRFRGGMGIRRDFEFPYAPMQFTVLSDGRIMPPWGLAGGGEGRTARYIFDPYGEHRELPSKGTIDIPTGGCVRVETPGGGGYGEPRERAPGRIEADLRDGKISAQAAEKAYGNRCGAA
jgi:N-methylhydantoinase B